MQLLIIAFALMVSILNRDFGPMLTSEKKAAARFDKRQRRPTAHRVSDVAPTVLTPSEGTQHDAVTQTDYIAQGKIQRL